MQKDRDFDIVRNAIRSALLLVLLSPVPAPAQTARDSITVELIDVPVYVSQGGKPVPNLTRDDFELFVNGRRQPIEYFDLIEPVDATTEAAPSIAAQAAPDTRRLFLFLFDLAFARPASLARARAAAGKMLDIAQPSDHFAVATFSSRDGITFLSAFTPDRTVTLSALRRLHPSSARDPLAIAVTRLERELEETVIPQSGGDSGSRFGDEADATLREIMAVGSDLRQMPLRRLAEEQMIDLAATASRVATLEGHKHVIFFSDGFSSYLMTGARPNLTNSPPPVDPRTLNVAMELTHAFRAAGALLHTVDLSIRDVENTDLLWNQTLRFFARETGGQFITMTGDIAGALRTLATTTAHGYRLSFRPGRVRKGTNPIEVRIRNVPGAVTLSYRRGFAGSRPETKKVDPLKIADIVLNDTRQTGVAPAISFGEKPNLLVAIPSRALAPHLEKDRVVDVYLYIFDETGKAVDYQHKSVPVPLDVSGDVVIRNAMKLGPGRYVAKAVLAATGSTGFSRIEFELR